MKESKWEDSPREDLRMIPVMKEAGFMPKFGTMDRLSGRTSPDCPPCDGVAFVRISDGFTLWRVIIQNTRTSVWRGVDVVNGCYVNPRDYESLNRFLTDKGE